MTEQHLRFVVDLHSIAPQKFSEMSTEEIWALIEENCNLSEHNISMLRVKEGVKTVKVIK